MTQNTPASPSTDTDAPSPPAEGVKRVLILTHKLDVTGAAMGMRLLGQLLQERGIEVLVASRDADAGRTYGREWFEQAGLTVRECPYLALPRLSPKQAWRALSSFKRFRELVHSFAPDVIDVQANTLAPFAHRSGAAFVTTFRYPEFKRSYQLIARWANRLTTAPFGHRTIAISDEMVEMLSEQLHIPRQRIRKIPYSVDDSYYRPPSDAEAASAREQLGVSAAPFVVGSVGMLVPRKNQAQLIEALGELARRDEPVQALLAGGGEPAYEQQLRELAEQRGVADRVHFLGHRDGRDVYWASDCHVLTSRGESFGRVSAEAMLCGRPVLSTPVGAAREMVLDGRTGHIVPLDDPTALADRLQAWLHEPDKRARTAEAAREHAAASFSRQRMIENVLRVYGEAVTVKRHTGS